MSKHHARKKLSEITNTQPSNASKKYAKPELCIVRPEDALIDLDVVDIPSGDGAFDDYQVKYPTEFNLYSSHF
ncbi:hypothetical protein J0A71_05g11340 [Encephalitozoon cuniculi]|nr:hypothetical protein J0A71_05g11340 [Encephalitozoon cuniculi]